MPAIKTVQAQIFPSRVQLSVLPILNSTNKYIQRIAKSVVFLCYSLVLIITQKTAAFGNS